ncbi:18757_t:CDS:1, partial [Funneliformis geosporum]
MQQEKLPQFSNPKTQSFINDTWLIENELNLLFSNISSILSIQTQITIATSNKDEMSLTTSRDSLISLTKNLLISTKNKIKSLELQNLKNVGSSSVASDFEIRNQRIIHIKEKFLNCLETYKEIEKNYMKQQKERLIRQYKIVNPDANYDDHVETDQPVFLQSIMDSINQRQNVEDSKRVLEEVNRRHEDIKQIERTIAELVELFEEMKLQVEIQDDHIVSITDNVQTVENDTKEVTDELHHSEENAK